MPLITCPDCGGSVSDAAPVCIHCGRPLAAARPAPPHAAYAYAAPPPVADPMARRVESRDARAASAKPIAFVVYGLFVLSFLYFIPGIIGVVVAYMKRGDARGTWVESHFDWQIDTFWKSFWYGMGLVVLAGVMFATNSIGLLLIVLYGGMLGVTLWYIYRIVRGALALYDERPIS